MVALIGMMFAILSDFFFFLDVGGDMIMGSRVSQIIFFSFPSLLFLTFLQNSGRTTKTTDCPPYKKRKKEFFLPRLDEVEISVYDIYINNRKQKSKKKLCICF